MTTTATMEFVRLFKQFLDLCLSPGWPADDAEPEEIIKALQIAHHVEMAVNKMKSENNCYDKFLGVLCADRNFSFVFLQSCMTDPPKFVLKKVINSDGPVKLIDIAFKEFRNVYSEERLIQLLSELMVEAASKETLLRNMSTMLPADKLAEFKQQLYLFVILECDSTETFSDTLKDCSQEMMDALILCLVKNNVAGMKKDDVETVRRKIIMGLTEVLICRDNSAKRFWELLFNVNKENLGLMCLKYKALGEMFFEAIKDMNVTHDLPSESCYVEFTQSHLYSKCNTIFQHETLKTEFREYLRKNGVDESLLPFLQS